MKYRTQQKLFKTLYTLGAILFAIFIWEIYIPASWSIEPVKMYQIRKGTGSEDIAKELKSQGIIKNEWFFRFYILGSGNYRKLQAGAYSLSPSMPVANIVRKLASGDIIKNNVRIIEGWDNIDVAKYLESKKIAEQSDFLAALQKDYSSQFPFLEDTSKKVDLEGYLFPDTYHFSVDTDAKTVITEALANFDRKLTPSMRQEIARQKKTIFQIVTMASILEKEVASPEDKKIVSGILWKRIENGVPLQVDATVNYVTGKNHSSVRLADTAIDSPYNTYKYYGLPLGPICNPGYESILAAIFPQKSNYWFYLSASETGKTIFSKSLDEHNAAIYKYLR